VPRGSGSEQRTSRVSAWHDRTEIGLSWRAAPGPWAEQATALGHGPERPSLARRVAQPRLAQPRSRDPPGSGLARRIQLGKVSLGASWLGAGLARRGLARRGLAWRGLLGQPLGAASSGQPRLGHLLGSLAQCSFARWNPTEKARLLVKQTSRRGHVATASRKSDSEARLFGEAWMVIGSSLQLFSECCCRASQGITKL
jgi:hypothetical protein